MFKNMKATGNKFALVLDEYGGMSGIITMMDLVQELVGDFEQSEPMQQEPEIEQLDSGTWKIRGSAALDEVSKVLGIELPDDDWRHVWRVCVCGVGIGARRRHDV